MIKKPEQTSPCSAPVYRQFLHKISHALKEALFPTRCLICRSFFHLKTAETVYQDTGNIQKTDYVIDNPSEIDEKNIFTRLTAPSLCPSCRQGFAPVQSPVCTKCGIMFKSREGEDHMCQECITAPRSFNIAQAAGVYNQSLMTAIHRLKYSGKIQLATPLGVLLFAAFLNRYDQLDSDIIAPVPLHKKRFRKRGFNQTFLLIKDWPSFSINTPSISFPLRIEKDLLVRNRKTKSQTGLDRKTRISNIKGAFSLNPKADVSGKRVLLVDDVYTTGATADECAKVLLKGNAGKVSVLTLARAMR